MARTFRRTPGDTRGRVPKAHRTPPWGRYDALRRPGEPDQSARDWDREARNAGRYDPNTYEPDPE